MINNEYTEDQIRQLIAAYAEHRAEGYSKESFPDCDYRTIESHLEKNPGLQPEKEKIEQAERRGRFTWEKIGKDLATGKIEGNATSYIFNMKNRYGWKDKHEIDQNVNLTMPDIELVPFNYDDEAEDTEKGN